MKSPNDSSTITNMKTKSLPILILAVAFAAAGCNSPFAVSGEYSTPKQTVSGCVSATTNSVSVSGGYSTTNQSISRAVSVGK